MYKGKPSQKGNMYEGRFDFPQIEYDKRDGCYVNCGEVKGEGIKQPVGTDNPTMKGAVPMGRVETMKLPQSYG